MGKYTICPCCRKTLSLDRLNITSKVDFNYKYKTKSFLDTKRELTHHYNVSSCHITCGECAFDLWPILTEIYPNIKTIIKELKDQDEINQVKELYNLYTLLIKQTGLIREEVKIR